MQTEKEIIKNLEDLGYGKVYVWNDEPNKIFEEHSHNWDTKLYILSGEMRLKLLNSGRIDDYKLKIGDEKEIFQNQIHSAIIGIDGCKYIVAERN